ncbi:hypothetical protein FSARC_14866 [Fusarium sarcochroum]|uniref:Uncharacterized protein n=1 Tax=Fusarium sarcochroum TaxID=1208366 RepID=A0A8H4WLX1_9HYPO|nr:hypothetical protein FSARC_14866 [Fusarium sarcochroum]
MENEAKLTQIGKVDLKRFVVQSALLSLIDPVRGEPTRSLLDEDPDGISSIRQQLKKKFLDAFALICSTAGSGAKTASAVCLEQYASSGAILRVARNHGLTPEDQAGLERVLQILQAVAEKGKYILNYAKHFLKTADTATNTDRSSTQAEADILNLIVQLDRGRILSLAEKVEKRGIQVLLRQAPSKPVTHQDNSETSAELDFRLWLEKCPFRALPSQTWNSATVALLIDWASQARWIYSEQLQNLLGLHQSEKPLWLKNLHKIARYRSAIKSMVKLAVKEPDVFTDIRIQGVMAPGTSSFSLTGEKKPLLAVVKNAVREDLEMTMEKLEKHLETQDIEARLRRSCRLDLTLHAEMQLVVFYEGNPEHLPRMLFIGTSKKACFLCHRYLLKHQLRLQVSACHQKIYPSWMPPPYYPLPRQYKSLAFVKLAREIEQLMKKDLKTALTAPRRPRNYDSTAGPSLTQTATVSLELSSVQAIEN